MQNCLSCSARATPDIKQMRVTWDKKIHYSTRVEQIKGLQIAWNFLKSKRIDSASVKSLIQCLFPWKHFFCPSKSEFINDEVKTWYIEFA